MSDSREKWMCPPWSFWVGTISRVHCAYVGRVWFVSMTHHQEDGIERTTSKSADSSFFSLLQTIVTSKTYAVTLLLHCFRYDGRSDWYINTCQWGGDSCILCRNIRTASLDTASKDTKNHEKLHILGDFTKVEVTGFGQNGMLKREFHEDYILCVHYHGLIRR
ncbi:hypothetical protein IW262DRAFT_1298120 [Armillaria fumosa]|nr:hypothetical protein IW262DRAFT_1298120 [Armillaria fumosa]